MYVVRMLQKMTPAPVGLVATVSAEPGASQGEG